ARQAEVGIPAELAERLVGRDLGGWLGDFVDAGAAFLEGEQRCRRGRIDMQRHLAAGGFPAGSRPVEVTVAQHDSFQRWRPEGQPLERRYAVGADALRAPRDALRNEPEIGRAS